MVNLIVTLPLPPRSLSPNSRGHWATKARAVGNYRADARLATLSALHDAREVCAWDAASIEPHFYHRANRKRDGDNATASLKAGFDGAVDAGLVKDDCNIRHLPAVFHIDKLHPRVELWITQEEKR